MKDIVMEKDQKKEEVPEVMEEPNNDSVAINVDIRVNNCFVNAKKSYLTDIQRKWSDFMIYEANANKSLMAFIADTEPVAASDTYCIVSNKIDTNNDLLNKQIDLLENDMVKFYGHAYKVVAVSNDRWNKIKEEYINNLKTGYKYNYMEENVIPNNTSETVSDLEALANEIFGNNGYEVE